MMSKGVSDQGGDMEMYDRINKEALWQVLRMYVGGKLLNGIRSMYANSLACVRVKEDERLIVG